MHEINLLAKKSSYDFSTTPATFLMHVDGVAGQQAPSGGGVATVEEKGNSNAAGLYSMGRFTSAVVAYGSTAADLSGGASAVLYCNATKANTNNHKADFTLEFYACKSRAALQGINPLATDRYSSDLTASYPGIGYPPSGFTSGRPMSFYIYMDSNGQIAYSMQGLTGTDTAWWNTRATTGVQYWNLLSTTKMSHFLFQMRDKVFEGYLDGKRMFAIANPNWTGAQYLSQLDIGNNYVLNQNAKDMFFDEVRYTKDVARAKGPFARPSSRFEI
jgi:hypothetical protein